MTTATFHASPSAGQIGDPTVALPSTLEVGHVLYAFHAMDWDTAADMLVPNSSAVREWVLLGTADHGTNSPHVKLWRGVAVKAGADNVVFNGVGGDSQIGAVLIAGQDAGVDKVATTFGDVSGSHAAPGVDPDNVDDLLITFVCTNGTTGGYTTPGSMTERTEVAVSSFFMGVLATEVLAADTATGTRTFTTNAGNVAFAAITLAIKGSGNIAPTLLDYVESLFGGTEASTETTDDLDWAASGNRIVALGITENNVETINTPTATGLTFAGMTGSPTNTTNSCKGYAWQATASGNGNSVVSATLPVGVASAGIAAWAWAGASAPSNPQVLVDTALTVSVTVEDNSSVVMILGDWDATADVAVDTVPAGGVIHEVVNNVGSATFAVVRWDNQPAGTRSYGLANWTGTGTITKLAVHVPGAASGGSSTVNSDLDVRWSVENLVNSDLDVRWSVANLVNSDLDVRWNVSSTVTSDLDVRWSVENLVNSDLDVRWSVANLVNSDLDVRWSVAGTTSEVTSDLDVRWSVANLINSDLDVRWSVSNLVNSDLDVRWSVANLINSDLDVRWSVANLVNSDLDVRWSVANSVNSDLDVRWSVANLVNSDLDVRWSVAGDAPANVESWGLQV